jgi:hypothetical protein
MSIYEPENWLVTLDRALLAWVESQMPVDLAPDVTVEMDFPDTRQWPKQSPLEKALVHIAQDDENDPTFGFGVPGDDEYLTDPDGTVHNTHREAAQHLVNFDVGVWSSAQTGGPTKRKEVVQALKNMFVPNSAKKALDDAEGIWVVSFDGGRNILDRINDVPVWRALEMTLIVRAVSRHLPATSVIVATDFTQDEQLTITVDDGTAKPVTTP